LAARREALSVVDGFEKALEGMSHVHRAYYAGLDMNDACDEEARSIRKRDLHAELIHDERGARDIDEADAPFFKHIVRQVAAVEIEGGVDWSLRTPGDDAYELFASDLEAITGGDKRAMFALMRRHTTVQVIPKDMAWRDDEEAEVAAARVKWLAAKVPDDMWQEEMTREEELLRSFDELGLQRDNQDENPASIRMRTRVWGHVGRA